MGIEGLLQIFQKDLVETNLNLFKGKTAAIDGMSWLYRGCYACSRELNSNIETKNYLLFFHKMALLIKRYSIRGIVVFDGNTFLPKLKTEENRRKIKEENLEKAKLFEKAGNMDESKKYYSRALFVTKGMINECQQILKFLQIEYIIAPYEADAQIAYLIKNRFADFAITEDSDLIAFGCSRIFFKLKSTGEGKYLDLDSSHENSSYHAKIFKELDLPLRIRVCAMSGCDYLPSIKGFGINKILARISKLNNKSTITQRLLCEPSYNGKISKDYEKKLDEVVQIFLYATVYNVKEKKLTSLHENASIKRTVDQKILGDHFPNFEEFCKGDLNIETLKPLDPPAANYLDYFRKTRQNQEEIQTPKKDSKKRSKSLSTTDSKTPQVNINKEISKRKEMELMETKRKNLEFLASLANESNLNSDDSASEKENEKVLNKRKGFEDSEAEEEVIIIEKAIPDLPQENPFQKPLEKISNKGVDSLFELGSSLSKRKPSFEKFEQTFLGSGKRLKFN